MRKIQAHGLSGSELEDALNEYDNEDEKLVPWCNENHHREGEFKSVVIETSDFECRTLFEGLNEKIDTADETLLTTIGTVIGTYRVHYWGACKIPHENDIKQEINDTLTRYMAKYNMGDIAVPTIHIVLNAEK